MAENTHMLDSKVEQGTIALRSTLTENASVREEDPKADESLNRFVRDR